MAAKNSAPAAETKKYDYVRKDFTYEGKRYTVRGKTEKEALLKKTELLSQLKRGELGTSSNMTAAAWCREWLDTYVKPRVRQPGQKKMKNTMSPKSYESTYVSKVEGYIIPGLGAIKLKDLRDIHLQRILNNEAGKSFSHVSKMRMIMKACFSQAVASRIITYDPSLRLTLPVTTKGTRRSLTDAERSVLKEVAKKHKHGLWVRLLLSTGIRPGESAALLVEDLKFAEELLSINKSVESGTYLVTDPKTSAGIRFVPIPKELLDDLRKKVADKAPSDFAFPQSDGKSMMSETCIGKYWESFTRSMDLAMGAEHTKQGHIYDPKDLNPDGTPMYPDENNPDKPRNGHKIAPDLVLYCLRHTYCTDLQKAGVPLNIARYLMGHADISTTANIYTHSDKDDALTAQKLINQYHSDLT